MPSPFPGMDPYLENPHFWPGLHGRLIPAIASLLNALLPEGYAADIDERVYIAEPERHFRPDVAVRETAPPVAAARPASGMLAVREGAAAAKPPLHLTFGEEVRERFVNVYALDPGGEERIVTAIEVLSPANKAAGTGRTEYRKKQEYMLHTDAHLVEIDLLRAGIPTILGANELWNRQPYDYAVVLHRAQTGLSVDAWPILLRERLPAVDIPLTAEEPPVTLDLQAAFDRSYDEGPYRRRIDYAREPIPPLSPADAEWADALLREKELRV